MHYLGWVDPHLIERFERSHTQDVRGRVQIFEATATLDTDQPR